MHATYVYYSIVFLCCTVSKDCWMLLLQGMGSISTYEKPRSTKKASAQLRTGGCRVLSLGLSGGTVSALYSAMQLALADSRKGRLEFGRIPAQSKVGFLQQHSRT